MVDSTGLEPVPQKRPCRLHLLGGVRLGNDEEIVVITALADAPPDTGVSSLKLVVLERLPSIEGATEILADVTFLWANGEYA